MLDSSCLTRCDGTPAFKMTSVSEFRLFRSATPEDKLCRSTLQLQVAMLT